MAPLRLLPTRSRRPASRNTYHTKPEQSNWLGPIAEHFQRSRRCCAAMFSTRAASLLGAALKAGMVVVIQAAAAGDGSAPESVRLNAAMTSSRRGRNAVGNGTRVAACANDTALPPRMSVLGHGCRAGARHLLSWSSEMLGHLAPTLLG